MTNIRKLIETILSDSKLVKILNDDERVYRDEPIIRTASQLPSYVPSEYRDMQALAEKLRYRPDSQIFYEQAKLMERFEDDCEYRGEFTCYYPTYRSMNIVQLRGYFTWRAAVRRGEIEPTSLSYVFVYLYELLNLVGVADEQEGFRALKRFWTAYTALDNRIDRYMKAWLADYIVYYGLDKSLLASFTDTGYADKLLTLYDYPAHADADGFAAISALSSYSIEKSRFYKAYPEDFESVTLGVYGQLNEHYGKTKNSLFEKLYGRVEASPHQMFGGAVVYDRKHYTNYEYTVHDLCRYSCKSGLWSVQTCPSVGEKSRKLGTLIRQIDGMMRARYGFPYPLQSEETAKFLTALLTKEIDRRLAENEANKKSEIEIDVGKLRDIRRDALETQSRLVVAEEAPEDGIPVPEAPFEAPSEPPAETPDETELNETERETLRLLLTGGDLSAFARSRGTLPSVLVDGVNDLLFGRFGDTVVVYEGDEPVLLEDYADEVKGIIGL